MLNPRHRITELSNPGTFIPAEILNGLGGLFKKCEEEISYEGWRLFGFDRGTTWEKFTNSVARRGIT